MLESGLSVRDIDNMSFSQRITWRECYLKRKEKNRTINKLDLAECINYAYVGSQPKEKGKANHGMMAFKRWRRQLINKIFPDNRESYWDMMKRRGKSLKVN